MAKNNAKQILKLVGGKNNVENLVHCATRLRFTLKDESKADKAALEALPDVLSVVQSGGQYQVVIGPQVADYYDIIMKELGSISANNNGVKKPEKVSFTKVISGAFTPLIPALAGAGIQMPKFCTAFNDQTKDRMGETVPVVLTIYEDKSFDFVLKTAPTAEMIKKACGIKKAASDSKQTVATLSAEKLKEIAEYKMPDLNANDLEGAMKIVAGTARNMGVKVEGLDA